MLACAVKTRKLCVMNCAVHRSGVTVDVAEAYREYFSMDGAVSQLRKKALREVDNFSSAWPVFAWRVCEHALNVPRLLCSFVFLSNSFSSIQKSKMRSSLATCRFHTATIVPDMTPGVYFSPRAYIEFCLYFSCAGHSGNGGFLRPFCTTHIF